MDEPPILFERRGGAGILTLNRPKALNALTQGMCILMAEYLEKCARDGAIRIVVIRGAGTRAFCAGGDMRAVYESALGKTSYARDFFRDEYRLNRRIKHYSKPYIALLHGIVMGGGAGVSVHGGYRVADETLDFAMPETGIGMFPDIGASYFLSRCPGETGLYLALTGARIAAPDMLYAGLATHFVPAARRETLLERLAGGETPDVVLSAFAEQPASAPLQEYRAKIDTVFSADSVEGILERLEHDGSPWAQETARTIYAKSPSATKLAFRQIRAGKQFDFDACMRMEFRLACRITALHDFAEGIRAALIDKDRAPKWQPPVFAAVDDEKIMDLFAPLGADEL